MTPEVLVALGSLLGGLITTAGTVAIAWRHSGLETDAAIRADRDHLRRENSNLYTYIARLLRLLAAAGVDNVPPLPSPEEWHP
jgi:hypothetical protein